jgi:predicted cobalt transporter CbtA
MPLDENIITWNVTNWITVVLMVAIGFALLGFAQNWWASKHSTQLAAAA